LREETLNHLEDGEREVLRVLMNRYPEALPRAEVRRLSGYASSTADRFIVVLAKRGLIVKTVQGYFHASEKLF